MVCNDHEVFSKHWVLTRSEFANSLNRPLTDITEHPQTLRGAFDEAGCIKTQFPHMVFRAFKGTLMSTAGGSGTPTTRRSDAKQLFCLFLQAPQLRALGFKETANYQGHSSHHALHTTLGSQAVGLSSEVFRGDSTPASPGARMGPAPAVSKLGR